MKEKYATPNRPDDGQRAAAVLAEKLVAQAGIAIAEVQVSKETGEIAEIRPLDPTVKLNPAKLEEIKSRIKPQVDAAVAQLLTRQTKATSKPGPDSFPVSGKGGQA